MKATFIASSEMARLTGVPQSSVVYYADKGVINPQRDSNGRRLFTRDDAEKLIAHRQALKAARKARPAAA
jgi:DNA-binding transcriptional MerR regulator